ncbi:MAG TPA: DUF3108 domain-containing protein [Azospirillaceae bacterium]|nr:DUF3108 domain-containing protein [Azospirillaceae bacterium]
MPCRTHRARRLALASALAALTALPAAAQPLDLSYKVYLGGVELLEAKARLSMGQERYGLELSAATDGVIGRLASWSTNIKAEGALTGTGLPAPRLFRSDSVWREAPRITALEYDSPGAAPRVTADPPPEKDREPVPDNLKAGTIDPMSATVAVLDAVTQGRGCGATLPVYDGRQRYDMVLAPQGTEQLAPSDVGAYAGPAEACRIEYKPVAGRWREQGRRDRDGDRRPRTARTTVWFAKAVPGGPALPVRLESAGPLGTLVMHLAKVQPVG